MIQQQIHRIVRDKARVQGAMASIVEWQSLKMQEYRYTVLMTVAAYTARFFELFGVRRPLRYEPAPVPPAIMITPCTWIILKRHPC